MQKYPVPSSLLQSAPSPLTILSLAFLEAPISTPPSPHAHPRLRLRCLPAPIPRQGMEGEPWGLVQAPVLTNGVLGRVTVSPISGLHPGAPPPCLPPGEQMNE